MASEIITRIDGAKHQENPHGNLYYPNRDLREKLYRYGLASTSERSFDKVLVRINEPSRGWRSADLTTIEEYYKIAEVNEYAKAQTWACKEAITRIFRYDPLSSGRLHTEFQTFLSIAEDSTEHSHKRRTNQEVDFNANHLRLFLAFNKLDVYGDGTDAYREIANLARVDRQTVKVFLYSGFKLRFIRKGTIRSASPRHIRKTYYGCF